MNTENFKKKKSSKTIEDRIKQLRENLYRRKKGKK